MEKPFLVENRNTGQSVRYSDRGEEIAVATYLMWLGIDKLANGKGDFKLQEETVKEFLLTGKLERDNIVISDLRKE